ncbi:TIR domain-containing protein [Paenibacillus sp. CMAA1364]
MSNLNIKPNLFIGSARESIKYASAIQSQIGRSVQVTPWFAGTFGVNEYTMESLERILDQSDYGIFVFSPDDVVLMRGKYVFITRDNTIFEMGLFWGKLRRNRVFCILPQEVSHRDDLVTGVDVTKFHLLSDLSGLTILEYECRNDNNYEAAVTTACMKMLDIIDREKYYLDPLVLLKQKEEELQKKQSILQFFWEFNRNVTVAEVEKYHALSEAVRNSFIPPINCRVTGVAFWQSIGSDGIRQVGGNVGRGKFYPFNAKDTNEKSQSIYVLDVYNSGKWTFFKRKEIEDVYVLCYPLGMEHVLSVHISGVKMISENNLEDIVSYNDELLRTIRHLVGGKSNE